VDFLGLLVLQTPCIILHDVLSLTLKVVKGLAFFLEIILESNSFTSWYNLIYYLFIGFGEYFIKTLLQFLIGLIMKYLEFIGHILNFLTWNLLYPNQGDLRLCELSFCF
jgi:hypothetical protein